MMAATMRGLKSRAGLKPACVNGAIRQMADETVRPMKTGAIVSDGLPTLQPSVKAKIMTTKMNVPNASPKTANGNETIFVS